MPNHTSASQRLVDFRVGLQQEQIRQQAQRNAGAGQRQQGLLQALRVLAQAQQHGDGRKLQRHGQHAAGGLAGATQILRGNHGLAVKNADHHTGEGPRKRAGPGAGAQPQQVDRCSEQLTHSGMTASCGTAWDSMGIAHAAARP